VGLFLIWQAQIANYWRWSFFSLAKTFSKLSKLKIWQTTFSKLLEMLLYNYEEEYNWWNIGYIALGRRCTNDGDVDATAKQTHGQHSPVAQRRCA
jgi:hypothetical protein